MKLCKSESPNQGMYVKTRQESIQPIFNVINFPETLQSKGYIYH